MKNGLVEKIESTYGGEFPRHSNNGGNMDNKQTAIKKLLSELQKGEESAKEKGYIDILMVEKIIEL